MKKKALILLVYLCGCLVCYKLQKYDYAASNIPWTVHSRNNAIGLSLTSWLGVIGVGIYIATHIESGEQPSTW